MCKWLLHPEMWGKVKLTGWGQFLAHLQFIMAFGTVFQVGKWQLELYTQAGMSWMIGFVTEGCSNHLVNILMKPTGNSKN